MRTKEEKEKIRQKAKADLKKDFVTNNKPEKKKTPPKSYGSGGFGR